MVEFNRRKNNKKFLHSPLMLAVILFIFLFLLKAVWGVYQKERLSAVYLEREQAELQRMNERKKELAQAVTYLKTDKGVDAEIRNKFRVVRPGESIAVIVGEEVSTTTITAPTTSPSFWHTYFGFLGF